MHNVFLIFVAAKNPFVSLFADVDNEDEWMNE